MLTQKTPWPQSLTQKLIQIGHPEHLQIVLFLFVFNPFQSLLLWVDTERKSGRSSGENSVLNWQLVWRQTFGRPPTENKKPSGVFYVIFQKTNIRYKNSLYHVNELSPWRQKGNKQTDTTVQNPVISHKQRVARFTSTLSQSYDLREIQLLIVILLGALQ